MTWIRRATLGTLLLAAGPAFAQSHQQPAPPKALAKLAFFLGTWTCKGVLHAMPGRPAGKFVAKTTIRPILGGHFAEAIYVQKRSRGNPHPVEARFWYGYDMKDGRFVSTYINNYGAHARLSSRGWQGDTWIDEGPMENRWGDTMPMRLTLKRLGPSRFEAVAAVKGPDGWMPFNESRCRRTGGRRAKGRSARKGGHR